MYTSHLIGTRVHWSFLWLTDSGTIMCPRYMHNYTTSLYLWGVMVAVTPLELPPSTVLTHWWRLTLSWLCIQRLSHGTWWACIALFVQSYDYMYIRVSTYRLPISHQTWNEKLCIVHWHTCKLNWRSLSLLQMLLLQLLPWWVSFRGLYTIHAHVCSWA